MEEVYGKENSQKPIYIDLLVHTTRKEGLLELENVVKEIPPEIGSNQGIQSAVSYVCGGLDGEDIIELLTAHYWVKNLQGEDALLYFIIIIICLCEEHLLKVIKIWHCSPKFSNQSKH